MATDRIQRIKALRETGLGFNEAKRAVAFADVDGCSDTIAGEHVLNGDLVLSLLRSVKDLKDEVRRLREVQNRMLGS